MNKILTAKLLKDIPEQGSYGAARVYELSERVMNSPLGVIVTEINEHYAKYLTPEEIQILKTKGVNLITISDANGFYERFVFANYGITKEDNLFIRKRERIDGKMTISINGGDKQSVKPDAVYLRRLASANNFTFGGIINE